ncbi:NADH-quinone oxidoreductase subunit C [Deinococcus cellulosilyticus]|uniref:NADH-quinone oxidoreductase subunit C n=1 Tax=Deinococcus cellulosilyticus (strain DSM 18568 / NBRC 106333 / KACC 11606 / 5516J-15) TaxID=1223518 RepID=A0A511N6B2_DEIC1|nr:NADH-quinone oxidoreductase subunit C [Deinococcus cellulosilyticus]GEM47998.1 NADH-quinone oxidoreductase subunit C [Deinococcus cellulosilyticus NBRC 106333 = KACC 11606]
MDPLNELLDRLNLKLETGQLHHVVVERDDLLRVAREFQRAGFVLMDVVGADYSEYVDARPKRFACIYNLYRIPTRERIFMRIYLADSEEAPSLYSIWKAANYLEREVYDLMGIVFLNHPDLRKVLTPEDLEGHPLRKDFPLGETPTLFNEGRFIDPPAFRAGLTGQDRGLTGWRGGERVGDQSTPSFPPTVDVFEQNISKGGHK